MIYNCISNDFYATCLDLYAWYMVNLMTLTFFVYFTMLLPHFLSPLSYANLFPSLIVLTKAWIPHWKCINYHK